MHYITRSAATHGSGRRAHKVLDNPTAHLHGHHVERWPHGPTNLENLAALCHHHHRRVHEGGYGLTIEADGTLAFTKPDGTHIPNVAPSTAVEPDHVDQVLAENGVTIEPRTADTHWGAGETMDYDHALTGIWYTNHPHPHPHRPGTT